MWSGLVDLVASGWQLPTFGNISVLYQVENGTCAD